MASAVGTYADLVSLKLRLNISDTTDDSLMTSLCNQVNSLVEGVTGRILAPIPSFSTTLNASVTAGATSLVLDNPSGVAVGDALLVGTVSGTREHFIVTAISATSTITPQAPLLNAYGSGASVARCQMFDGPVPGDFGWGPQRLILAVPNGINSISSLEVTPTWNAASTGWYLMTPTDYLIRPTPLDREPGWPGTEVHLSPIPSAGNTYPYFAGYDSICRIVGTFGWPAVPDEIVDIALTTATRAWVGRQAGQQDIVGTDTFGRPMVSRYLSGRDRDTLQRYTSKDAGIV